MKDFYYILGVDTNSSLAEIEEAYLKLSQKFQPESDSGDEYFKGRFAETREAFETLANPQKRSAYDLRLARQQADKQPLHRYQTKRFKRKGPGIGVMLAIIITIVIFGAYFSQYLITSKPVKLIKPIAAVTEIPVHKFKKHRKHSIKKKVAADSVSHHFNVAKVPPVIKANPAPQIMPPANPIPAKTVLIKQVAAKPAPDSVRIVRKNYLYTAFIHANVTGIVNMRAEEAYGSAVIETIPENAKVFVLAEGERYYRVRFNGYTGYVPRWSVVAR